MHTGAFEQQRIVEIPTPGVLDYQAKNKMSKSFFHDIHLTWICCCLTSKLLISPNNISHLAFLLPFYLALEGGSWNCWHFLPPGTAQSWTSLFLNLLRGIYGLGLSSSYHSNFLRLYHEFKHKSWSNFIFRISTKHQLQNFSQHLDKTWNWKNIDST